MLDNSNTVQVPGPPKVLIANDQEWTARSLESIFVPEGYEVTLAYTGAQALSRAFDLRPDLIVLDFQLPDISGAEVCRLLRADPRIGWGTPIVLTTAGSNGRGRLAEALAAGAWDFQPQPFDGPVLLSRIRTYLLAKATLDGARRDALLEPGTGLYSRRGLEVRLNELSQEVRRTRQPVTCVVVAAGSSDLREANETAEAFGNSVARALRARVRGSDIIARLGALEFAVVAPTLAHDGALSLVDRLQRAAGDVAIEGGGGGPESEAGRGHVRTGVATTTVADLSENFDGEDLLRRAVAAVDWAGGGEPHHGVEVQGG